MSGVARPVGAALASLALAAPVVGAGALFDPPPLVYPAAVVGGALATLVGASLADVERPAVFALWPPGYSRSSSTRAGR